MTQRDLLQGIKKAEARAEDILKEGETWKERVRAETEAERSRIFEEAKQRTDSAVARMEMDIEAQFERLKEKSRGKAAQRAEAMKSAAAGRMPDLVNELVDEFRGKVVPGKGR
jgi:vacuolar-type H+-ATPase subunit H